LLYKILFLNYIAVIIYVDWFIKSSLSKLVTSPALWKVPIVQFILNNTVNSALLFSPAKLLFGFEQKDRTDDKPKMLFNDLLENESDFQIQR